MVSCWPLLEKGWPLCEQLTIGIGKYVVNEPFVDPSKTSFSLQHIKVGIMKHLVFSSITFDGLREKKKKGGIFDLPSPITFLKCKIKFTI